MLLRPSLVIAITAFVFGAAPLTRAEDATPKPDGAATAVAAAPATPLLAKEAGARYGQALGAVEICFGSKVTEKAKSLGAAYTGTEQVDFQAQSVKIYAAWAKVKACSDQLDPNKCKIIMDSSCLSAETEIGATGNVIPGLVEFAKH